MQKPNAVCKVCGADYRICRDCTSMNSWRVSACSRQHYQIRQIFLSFRDGLISADVAKTMLDRVGEFDYSAFTPGYRAFFTMLYAEPAVDVQSVEVDESVVAPTQRKRRSTKAVEEAVDPI